MKSNSNKLERTRTSKREPDEAAGNSSKRPHMHRQAMNKNTCIFCEKDTGLLHEFRTLDAIKM